MTTHVRVAIIGGGIVGCGIQYHLAKLGWTDTLIVEKAELTAGCTWHAAGNLSHYASSAFWTRVQKWTTELYEQLAAECGHDVGFHRAGSIRLATLPEHLIENRRAWAKAQALGVEMHLIGPGEIKRLFPFVELHDVLGGAFTPGCGSADPSSVTFAMAERARALGAKISQGAKVTALSFTPNSGWRLETTAGPIVAEIVVNAAGMWAPEIMAMLGIDLPFVIFLHQHLVTEPSPLVAALTRRLPTLRDPLGGFNVRQEGMGLLSGVYEHEPAFWGENGVPPGFGREVFAPDWERSQDFLDNAVRRVPLLGQLGIKMVYNAPTSRTPDHNPLCGPVPGLRNFYLAAGFAAGIMQSATTRLVAQWIAEGEPEIDCATIDVKRYGPHATKGFTYAVVRAGHKFAGAIDYPHGERGAARPGKTSPLHAAHRAARAVFGARNGWEVPLWFAPPGVEAEDRAAFGAPAWWPHVRAEALAAHDGAAMFDATSFSKFALVGADACAALDRLSASAIPATDGAVAPLVFLTPQGRIAAWLLGARWTQDRYALFGPPEHEDRDFDWLWRNIPPGFDARLENGTNRDGALLLVGPGTPRLLDQSPEAASAHEIVAGGVRAMAVRGTAYGSEGFLVTAGFERLAALHGHFRAAGVREIGLRALDALRLWNGVARRGLDIDSATTAGESALAARIAWQKRDYIGRDTAHGERARGPARRLAWIEVSSDIPPHQNDAVFDGDRAIGLVGSGSCAQETGRALAFASLPAALAAPGTPLAIEILGARKAAVVLAPPSAAASSAAS